jgi:transcriptional regulator with XRE-family HTH domain
MKLGYRERGVKVLPERVRAARLEAGLSMARLADTDMTRAMVQMIESGRARPSVQKLRIIARRTRKPVSYFLPQGVVVDEKSAADWLTTLEQLALANVHEQVVSTFEAELTAVDDLAIRLRAQVLAARSLILSGHPEDGHRLAQSAFDAARAIGDSHQQVEAQAWAAAALSLQNDPGALAALESALTSCRSLRPPAPELEVRLLMNIGRHHVAAHRWTNAIEAYGRALEASDNTRDLVKMARMYDGLALAHREMGDLSGAEAHAQRALGIHELARSRNDEIRTRVNLAELLVRDQRLEEARQQIETAMQLHALETPDDPIARLLNAKAEVELAVGSLDDAEQTVKISLVDSLGKPDPVAHADGLRLRGRLAFERGERNFRGDYLAAIDEMSGLGYPERVAEMRAEFAHLLDASGDRSEAFEQLKLAAAEGRPSVAAAMRPARATRHQRRQRSLSSAS